MKKFSLSLIFLLLLLSGCGEKQKYEAQFFDVFDTVSSVSVYAANQSQADEYTAAVHDRLLELHRLYDPYNDYDGINNLKTVNDNAGIAPVSIDKDLYTLLGFGVQAYHDTNGAVDISMGGTIELWHKYRDNAIDNNIIEIPSAAELEATRTENGIESLVLTENSAYITDKNVSLNLGAFAKGYATDEALKVLKDMGCDSALVNLGGNVGCYRGKAKDKSWIVGIQDPLVPENLLDTVPIDNGFLISSGDYQRYYIYNGQKIHHIIDPDTLMPADKFSGTTVVCSDGTSGDMLSTALFILPQKDGAELARKYGAEKMYWIDKNGEQTVIDNNE